MYRGSLFIPYARALARELTALADLAQEDPGEEGDRAFERLTAFKDVQAAVNARMKVVDRWYEGRLRRGQARNLYRKHLPTVRSVRTRFLHLKGQLLLGKLSGKVIKDLLSGDADAAALAADIKIEWNTKTLADLCSAKPSDWLIERIGGAKGVGPRTAKKLVYREKVPHRG
jgi:hypothetical protein